MKLQLIFLLLALICTSQVLSLRCYTGEGDDKLEVETVCSHEKTFCKTEYKGDSIVKSCAARCVQTYETACCQTDLCTGDTL